MLAPYADPTIGTVVSLEPLSNEKFVVGKILKGGFGSVYQLVPVRPDGMTLALKTYQETANREQFIREAEVWISVAHHPNVARALGYLEWRSRPSVVAEWYDRSLADTDIRAWSSSTIVSFVLQLINGLSYAADHARVVHQDIKPANILIDESGAPRISDFGLAKFAPRSCAPLGSIADVQPTMRHSVSSGKIYGTPLYMAPELFGGAVASTQTDIFSLGVTLYQALTHEHPFIAADGPHRLVPLLRRAPLHLFLKKHGAEIRSVVLLIVAALELTAERRAATYSELLATAGLKSIGRSPHEAEIGDVITRAQMFRHQGRLDLGFQLLHEALQDRPANPMLLNSYAILLMSAGKQSEARAAWESAIESLAFTSGRYNHFVFLEPVVNLAGQLISAKEFRRAADLLSRGARWVASAPAQTDGSPGNLVDYFAFGWWYLYKGQFRDACNFLLGAYKSKVPDEASLLWLTLAAWLAGTLKELAAKIADLYLQLPRFGLPVAVSSSVVAAYCHPSIATKLVERAYLDRKSELDCAARELGLEPPRFNCPIELAISRTIIRSLDFRLTGGKFRGLIG